MFPFPFLRKKPPLTERDRGQQRPWSVIELKPSSPSSVLRDWVCVNIVVLALRRPCHNYPKPDTVHFADTLVLTCFYFEHVSLPKLSPDP